jgi:hypothetical protein
MRRCLDLLVPRGLGVFVIPSGFLTGAQNRKLRERVLLRHHLEVAFRLPSETTTGKDLFPGAHNVVDVLWSGALAAASSSRSTPATSSSSMAATSRSTPPTSSVSRARRPTSPKRQLSRSACATT